MPEEMIKIDVESIMEEIRSNINLKNYTENNLSFQDVTSEVSNDSIEKFSIQELNANLSEANRCCNIQANHEIISQGAMGRISVFVKKVIRKLTQFYVVPIVDEQRAFNCASVRNLNQIAEFIKSQQDYRDITDNLSYELNKKVKKEIKIVENSYSRLMEENVMLKKQINELAKKQEEYDNLMQLMSHKADITMLKCDKLELLLEKRKES